MGGRPIVELRTNQVEISSKCFTQSDTLLLLLVYTASYWLLLLNRGIYWDDWCIFLSSNSARKYIYSASARPIYGYYFIGLLHPYLGLGIAKIFCFFVFSIPMLVTNSILKHIKEIPTNTALFIAIFVGIYPVTGSRMIITISQYGLSLAVFFLAFGVLSSYLTNRKIFLRVLSIVLFYLSFNMDSLLVFFITVPLYIFYRCNITFRPLKILLFILNYIDFFIVPLAFFAIKNMYFKPYGLYENYNSVTLEKILNSNPLTLRNIQYSSIDIFLSTWTFMQTNPIEIAIFSALLLGVILTLRRDTRVAWISSAPSFNFVLAVFGAILLYFSMFPYAVTDNIANAIDWNDRNQILAPFGISLFLFGSIELILSLFAATLGGWIYRLRLLIYVIPLTAFTLQNNLKCLDYEVDWYKQLSIIFNVRKDPVIAQYSTFHIFDATKGLNVNGRSYRFYEFAGLLRYAFGEDTRFASETPPNPDTISWYKPFEQYNFNHHLNYEPIHEIHIDYGEFTLDRMAALHLLKDRLLNPDKFDLKIEKIIKVKSI